MTEVQTPDDLQARVERLFPDGVPDIAIGGMDVQRSTVTAIDIPEGGQQPPLGTHWTITALPGPDQTSPIGLVGDLSIFDESWFLGVTVHAFFVFRPGTQVPRGMEEINAFGLAHAPWANNILFDFAAMHARQLVASSLACTIKVPSLTPEVAIGQMHEHPDEEGEGESAGPKGLSDD